MATSAAASSMLSTGLNRSYNKLRLLKKKHSICKNLHTHTWISRENWTKTAILKQLMWLNDVIMLSLHVIVITSKSWFHCCCKEPTCLVLTVQQHTKLWLKRSLKQLVFFFFFTSHEFSAKCFMNLSLDNWVIKIMLFLLPAADGASTDTANSKPDT